MRLWFITLVAALGLPALASDPAVKKTVVILGDSLAAGSGVDLTEAFPALLQKKIDEAALPFTVVNAGVSGDTTAGGLRRLDWLLRRHIDVLMIELGGNDGLRGIPPEVTRTNIQSMIDRVKKKYPEVQIVIAGMQMPPNMGKDYTKEFQNVFPEIARKNNAALVPFLLEGVGGKTDMNLPDMIHPNPAGHKLVAENVWAVLKPILEADGSRKGAAN